VAPIDAAAYGPVPRPPEDDDRRIRVLTLALDAGSGYGGAEKLAYEFALGLDPGRFRSYLCTIRAPFPDRHEATARDAAELATAGVELLSLNRRSAFPLSPTAWWPLYSLLVRERIDILHAHMPRASVPGAIVARLARVPIVISHEHGSTLERKLARPFLDRNVVARLSTVMLSVSEWDRRQLIDRERIPPDRIRVLPNGISEPRARGLDVRAELHVPAGTSLIGAVGRLYPEKGYDDLIRAVALLSGAPRPIRCVIVGIGPHEQHLRELIDELQVRDQVRLLGRRDDVPDLVRALDVAVLCSRREGSPLAMLEYMAGAAPIIATAVGGVPELIEDGVHGLLVEPQDPEALAAGIERLLDDPDLAQRLGRAGRERQQREYGLTAVLGRLERLYAQLYSEVGNRPINR
jgi:glycosyltransferase involved in cell wall biosynthesis